MNAELTRELEQAAKRRQVLLDSIHRALATPKNLTIDGWQSLCRDAGAQLQHDAGLIARIGQAHAKENLSGTEPKAGED